MKQRRFSTNRALSLVILVAVLCSVTWAGDWPHWRGPNYNGISDETGFLTTWPKEGPKVLWKASLGIGFSAISVADGRAYAMGNVGKKTDVVYCFDAETGKVTEYELSYTVRFSMSRPDASELLAPQRVTRIRNYIFNPDTVLGNESEQQLLHREMREDALRQILVRLSAVAATAQRSN